jgi:hypothetical protein
MVDLKRKNYDPQAVDDEDLKPKKPKYFPALESGYYKAIIEDIEIKSTKNGDQQLKFTFVVKHGNDKQYLKRSVCIDHPNDTCTRIGFGFCKSCFIAVGLSNETDTDLLIGKRVLIDVEKSDAYSEDELFKAKAGVRYYYECRLDKEGYFNRIATVLPLDDKEAMKSITQRKEAAEEAAAENKKTQKATRERLILNSSSRPKKPSTPPVEYDDDDVPF